MKFAAVIGVVLIISGVIALAYQGVSYTTREKTMEIGPLQLTTEQSHTIPFAPAVGITLLICGGGIALISFRKKS